MSASTFVPLPDWCALVDPNIYPDDIWGENKQKPLLIDFATSDVSLDIINFDMDGSTQKHLKRLASHLKDHIIEVYFFIFHPKGMNRCFLEEISGTED